MADLNENKLVLKVKKLNEHAKIPVRAHNTDAGLDLFALHEMSLPPGSTIKVPTGIALEIPEGYCGILKDRSSIGFQGLTILGGVIDSAYRGEINIILHNTYHPDPVYTYDIAPGDKIAQILIVPVPEIEVKEVKELNDSDRQEKGFGSSGR